MDKMYKHPMLKDKFIGKDEYFAVLETKAYDMYLDNFNEPINN